MKNTILNFLLIILCSWSLDSFAQQGDTLEIQHNKKGRISYGHFKPNESRKISDVDKFLKKTLKAKQYDEFIKKKEERDESGIMHLRFQQHYKGIKVEGAEYLVHGKDAIETINGNYEEIEISSVKPAVSESQALKTALQFVNAQKYRWDDAGMEKFIKQHTGKINATYFPKGQIVIAKDVLKDKEKYKLSWKFTISSSVPLSEQLIYVDAMTGEVIGQSSLICNVNTPATAQTFHNAAPLQIITDSFNGGFRLREVRNGVTIQTLNLNGTSNFANATDFVNTNSNWTAGNWVTFAQDRHALDAHWGAEMVFDYWRIVHNRNSIDGNGIRALSYIHFSDPMNAFWFGGENNRFMVYGDGNGFTANPFTALDVCAHEFGHGVNEFTANLGIGPGLDESDALNEGFSDIWAACVERWAAPNKQAWLIGEEIFPSFTSIRNLQNPNDANTFEGPHPNAYKGDFWDPNHESHNNSSVLSHWFFLLSEGNLMTDGVQGIGINSAAKIAYRTLRDYLTSSSNYLDARNGSIMAARAIYGNNSEAVYTVASCWAAVGVGSSPLPYNGDLQGPTQLTPGYVASYFINPPVGATNYVWSIPSGCHANYCWKLQQGQGTNHIVVKAGKTGGNQQISCRIYNAQNQLIRHKYILVNVQNPYGGGGGGGGGSDPCGGSTNPNALTYHNSVIYPPEPCDDPLIAHEVRFVQVIVYSASGYRIKDAENVNSMSLNDLAPGLYIVKALLSTGEMSTVKVLR